jgi:hypothetical protein
MKNIITKNKKIIRITVISMFLVSAIIFVARGGMINVYRFLFDPYRGTVDEPVPTLELSALLTREEAIEDIDYILRRLRTRHPACMKGLPEDVIEQSRIEKESFSEEVTVLQLWQAAARILAVFGDSHTSVWLHIEDYMYRIPVSFQYTDGRLYLARGEFTGSAVISIGGITVEDLYLTYKSQMPHEREEIVSYFFPYSVRWQHMLAFLNADVSQTVIVVFETPDGEASEEYEFVVWEVTEDDETTFIFHEIDEENSVGILTITSFSFDDGDIYREAAENFFTDVKENEIQTIVVDLRENGGGYSWTAYYFIRYLDVERYTDTGGYDFRYGPVLWKDRNTEIKNQKFDDLLFSGDVYVLTSIQTYSAATIFAAIISDNNLGKIVGETSGQPPSFYGGVLYFQTPNAKLHFGISGGYFRRPDESKSDLYLFPDYPSAASEALETVYQLLR